MGKWFSRIARNSKSAESAKERLKLVLIHDRTDISPLTLDKMKDEILKVISNHVVIDPLKVKIRIMHDGREQRLVADIPIKTQINK
ncbi:MAG: cell division topological specificity factor MinE [Anaerolineaceae bacterium]|nr:cell division topological specificity factor MinE [Anaerolineaceae bacterium]